MKYVLMILMLVLVGCTEPPKPDPKLEAVKAEEKARYDKGPKYKSGCYKVVNKKHRNYGCTFQSTQGSMFVNRYGDNRWRMESDPRKLSSEERSGEYKAEWQLIWNRKIRCLDNQGFFVPERDVKPIKCPEYLYH